MAKTFTKTEAARHCGVTFPTIATWIRAGYKCADGRVLYLKVTSTEGGKELLTAASVRKLAKARAADHGKTETE